MITLIRLVLVTTIVLYSQPVYGQYGVDGYAQDCMTFNMNLSLIQVSNIIYTWDIGSKGKTVESINFIIVNNSDNCMDGIVYKLTISDPKGKVLYSKTHQMNGYVNGRGKSDRQSIFFTKGISSNWTFLPDTHPLKFEVIEIKQNKKRNSEYIAWQIDNKMKDCPSSKIESACKLMLQIYPNIIVEREKPSSVNTVYNRYDIYFDDKKMQAKLAYDKRVADFKNYLQIATDYHNRENARLALENYLLVERLLDTNVNNEKIILKDVKSNIFDCYKNLNEYEKAADIIITDHLFSNSEEDILAAARLYYKAKLYDKSYRLYDSLTNRSVQKYNISQYKINPLISHNDWANFKESIYKNFSQSDVKQAVPLAIPNNRILEQVENEFNRRYNNFKEIINAAEKAALNDRLNKVVDVNASNFYTVTLSRNNQLLCEFDFEVFPFPQVSKEFISGFNDLVYKKMYDGSFVTKIQSKTGVVMGWSSFLANSVQNLKRSIYTDDKKLLPKVKFDNQKGLILKNDDTGQFIISLGQSDFFIEKNDDPYYSKQKPYLQVNLKSYTIVGKIVSGLECLDKLSSLKSDKEGYYLTEQAMNESSTVGIPKPNFEKEIILIHLKRKID